MKLVIGFFIAEHFLNEMKTILKLFRGKLQIKSCFCHIFIFIKIYLYVIATEDAFKYTCTKANLKNIFVSLYPTLFYGYGSVGRIVFNFSNWIPIKLKCIQ